jgi:hypothetical protein
MQNKKSKLFFIGFNKTATTSLHELFTRNGYDSVHWMVGNINLAEQMKKNKESGHPILSGVENFQIYSDLSFASETLIIEGNLYFRELHLDYPESWFVLNTRNTNSWILSRLRHPNLTERYLQAMDLSIPELVEYWKTLKMQSEKEIVSYFSGYPRFLIYDLDSQSFSDLASFLRQDFTLTDTRPIFLNSTPTRL